MDDAATTLRKQRQMQMEEKRKRLEDLRQRRKDKQQQRPQYSIQASSSPPSSVTKQNAEEQDDLDAVIKNLLGKDHPAKDGEQIYTRTGEETREVSQTPHQPHVLPRTMELSKSGLIGLVHENHAKPEFYDKECQTEQQSGGDDLSSEEDGDSDKEELQGRDDNQSRRLSTGSSLARRCLADSARSVVTTCSSFEAEESGGLRNGSSSTTMNGVKELTEDDKDTILCSEEFKLFLGDTARVLERALNERSVFDILLDYRVNDDDSEDEESTPPRTGGMRRVHHAHDRHWSANRSATDMHWSPHHAERFLASYGALGGGLGGTACGDLSSALSFRRGRDGSSSDDPDGVVLVWSLASEEYPEFIFHAQSPVLAAKFHTFETHLIAGGTYLGEVLLWDTRAKSFPAQRTRLVAGGGHTYPVYSLKIVGTSSAHTIMTASTDGKLAWWDPRQLDKPIESMLVVAPSDENRKRRPNAHHETMSPVTTSPVAITCMDFGGGTGAYTDSDAEVMVLGSESGDLYTLPTRARHCKDIQCLSGHFGMITSVAFHPSSSSSSSSLLSGLMVSSSVDWTTQLWHKSHSGRGGTRALATLSSGRYDYVCSAQWSPGRPALLAVGSSAGGIDMWDLLHSMKEPLVSVAQESKTLTGLAWSEDGRCIVAGDNLGSLYIYAVPQEVVMPQQDEESKLDHLLLGLVAPRSTGDKL